MTEPKFPPSTPEYEAYAAELRDELGKFARGEEPYPYPITETTRLSANGSTTVTVTPPAPCGLLDCVGELHVSTKGQPTMRVHLNNKQRRELMAALTGGVL